MDAHPLDHVELPLEIVDMLLLIAEDALEQVAADIVLHARILRHWGVTKLGKHEYEESIDEMRHADWLIERILFLGGLPNVQRMNQVLVGQTVQEILECDLKLEDKALADLRDGIAHCETVRDYVTRDLFMHILDNEEEHVDFLERQFDMIERMGIQNYIQIQSKAAGEE